MSVRTLARFLGWLTLSVGCGATELSVPDASTTPDASSGLDASTEASPPPPDATSVDSPTTSDSSPPDSAPSTDSSAPIDAAPCSSSEHLCSGICYPNDIQHCGPSCVACGAPANGYATCDGTQCGFACNVLECGSTCVDPTTDPHNCGACSHDCGEASCQNSICQPIAITSFTSSGVVLGIAVDANNVYYSVGEGGSSVFQASLVGGLTITLTSTANDPGSLAVDATNVYYADCVGSVDKIPIGGGPTTRLDTENLCIGELTRNGEDLFYLSSKALTEVPADGSSAATTIGPGANFAVDANNLYWAIFDGNTHSTIFQLPRGADAAAAAPIATNVLGNVIGLAVDATNVYFSDGGHVWSVPIGGGTVTTLSPASGSSVLVADATGIYWADANNAIRTVAAGGGSVAILAQPAGETIGNDIVVDSTYVYFYEHDQLGNWTIEKVPK